MDFTIFSKLLQDFDVYPSLISKGLLHSIFHSLSERYKEISGDHRACIDEVLFLQSLIVISMSINMPLFKDDMQKLCWLVERMSQSNGPV